LSSARSSRSLCFSDIYNYFLASSPLIWWFGCAVASVVVYIVILADSVIRWDGGRNQSCVKTATSFFPQARISQKIAAMGALQAGGCVSDALTFSQLRVLMNLHSVATRVRIDASPTLHVFFSPTLVALASFLGIKRVLPPLLSFFFMSTLLHSKPPPPPPLPT
jgi:hypothetical protein